MFSLVIKHTSIKNLLSLIAYFDMELEERDVKIVFIYGKLEESTWHIQKGLFILDKSSSCVS